MSQHRKVRDSKQCQKCGGTFERNRKHSIAQWASTAFCSSACSNKSRATHGMRHTRLYRVWAGIKTRCLNKSDPLYLHYGARGITVCAEWRDDFEAFAQYIGVDPGREFQVGRIDNNVGYQPGNVRWESKSQNMRNKRDTRWVEFGGERMPLVAACEKSGVSYKLAHGRLTDGWSVERALAP